MARKFASRDPEDAGRFALVTIRHFVDATDVLADDGLQGEMTRSLVMLGRLPGTIYWSLHREIALKGNMLRLDRVAIAKEHNAAHGMVEFAQVSRPGMIQQHLHGSGINGRDAFPNLSRGGLQFDGNQGWQIFLALAQRRNEQHETIKTMIEILAKLSRRNPLRNEQFVAEMMRTFERCRRSPPTRSNSPYSTARKIFAWANGLMSVISSRKSVPV